jgi:hypothetical protein
VSEQIRLLLGALRRRVLCVQVVLVGSVVWWRAPRPQFDLHPTWTWGEFVSTQLPPTFHLGLSLKFWHAWVQQCGITWVLRLQPESKQPHGRNSWIQPMVTPASASHPRPDPLVTRCPSSHRRLAFEQLPRNQAYMQHHFVLCLKRRSAHQSIIVQFTGRGQSVRSCTAAAASALLATPGRAHEIPGAAVALVL